MHAISSYRGNRPTLHPPTNTHTPTNPPTHRQDRLQYIAPQLARREIIYQCAKRHFTGLQSLHSSSSRRRILQTRCKMFHQSNTTQYVKYLPAALVVCAAYDTVSVANSESARRNARVVVVIVQ